MKRLAERAGITKHVTPHILRHTCVANCVTAGVSTASLKTLLGLARLERRRTGGPRH
ncbi:MAG: tyrosine-type recombinase/integrase [Planctomycetes bacterium]|nr:tyrosine-type recombinase/integrase [Planctomycetota bacterium]